MSPTLRSAERGVALLEAMVAIAILASAGVILVGTVGAGLRSEREARRREATVHAAERILTAMTLLTRRDLDQRIGTRRIGEFLVDVQRPEPTLYRIALSESAVPEVELLTTVVYRESP